MWEPGRWAWKLENIRPLKQTVMGTGALGLWKPIDLLVDRLVGVELCDRVDDSTDDCWTGVRNCVAEVIESPGLQDEILKLYQFLSDRQRAEVIRRLPDDEAPGAETATAPDIFDQIQVGDRLDSGYNTSTCICIKKSLKPRQIKVKWLGGGAVTDLCEESVNVMRLGIKIRLTPGLRIKYQGWYGRLSSRLKNGNWYVNWEGFPVQGLRKKYGEPPKCAIAPQDFEVVE
ncbi:hypothetical protein [Coleofasciculus sp. E2-BRE-01]|uniref:hypothetical protein n=1 Tax=Coleofasciculus sp. E2-BRE-01 TaxID=3069524 RepID=UPI0040649ECD